MKKSNLWTVTDLDRKLWKGIYQDYSDKNLLLEIDFLNARAVLYADDRWELKWTRYRMLILMTEIARRGLKVTQDFIFN